MAGFAGRGSRDYRLEQKLAGEALDFNPSFGYLPSTWTLLP